MENKENEGRQLPAKLIELVSALVSYIDDADMADASKDLEKRGGCFHEIE